MKARHTLVWALAVVAVLLALALLFAEPSAVSGLLEDRRP